MSGVKNGGPAFPLHPGILPEWEAVNGMSLRDYFAIHCDQPGVSEIVNAAGLKYKSGLVLGDDDSSLGSFNEWYGALTSEERYRLYATVRYALADAMIAARESSE